MFLKKLLSSSCYGFYSVADHLKNDTEIADFLRGYSPSTLIISDSHSARPAYLLLDVSETRQTLIYKISRFFIILSLARVFSIPQNLIFSSNQNIIGMYDWFCRNLKGSVKGNIGEKNQDLDDFGKSAFLFCLQESVENPRFDFFKEHELISEKVEIREKVELLSKMAIEKFSSLMHGAKDIKFLCQFGYSNELVAECDIYFDGNIVLFTSNSLNDLAEIQNDSILISSCALVASEYAGENIRKKYLYSIKSTQLFETK